MAPILPKQKQRILQYLKDYIADHGYAPTLTEIAKEFKLSSLATVHEHVGFLEDRGFIRRIAGEERGIKVIERQREEPDAAWKPSITLPLVGVITAGKPIEAIERPDETISVPQEIVRKKNAYVLKVRGDSMIESLIADGDYVVVEKTDYARDGDMVVAMLDNGTATLKKLFRKKNFVRLQPANKAYKPIDVPSVIIQGRVLGVMRSY
ncbi:MAG: transcriptional repressor LexA [Candidatus Kerfeldbacteria bacterium]|nr:transcriptional repressor LexA [Candidatus Kerfeldbacteria bacterium]